MRGSLLPPFSPTALRNHSAASAYRCWPANVSPIATYGSRQRGSTSIARRNIARASSSRPFGDKLVLAWLDSVIAESGLCSYA